LGKLYNKYPKKDMPICTVSIPEYMIKWAEEGTSLSDAIKGHDFKLRFGHDIMGHINKGVTALRIGGTDGVTLSNVKICKIINIGPLSGIDNRAQYGSNYEKATSNISEELGTWYAGNMVFGVMFSTCTNVKMSKVTVESCHSETGEYYEYFYNNTKQKEIKYF